MKTRIFLTVVLLMLGSTAALAQTTAFTYQGKLADGGNPANGNYDLTFQLFDTEAAGTGTQQGTTLSLTNVAVKGGVFTAQLDFGACASCFNGASRFLEIALRPSGGSSFTTMSPRQPLTSTPYAVKSMSATTADGLSLTCTSCVTSSQIQSVQGSQVTGNIAGNQVNGTIPVASVPPGSASYIQNTTSVQPESKFNISGNGFVGGNLGVGTTSPVAKLHVMGNARLESPVGTWDIPRFSFNFAGAQPEYGKWQNYAAPTELVFAALDDTEKQEDAWLVVQRAGASISDVVFPRGIHLRDVRPTLAHPILRVETTLTGGTVASFGSKGDFQVDSAVLGAGGRFVIKENGRVGIGITNPADALDVDGFIRLTSLGGGGSTQLCQNGSRQISVCSSSLRYKTDLHPFNRGLNLINRLHPITFKWKADQTLDLGLGAEDVAAVEPLLVTHNEKGEVEGVKYDRLSAVFINAFKEQQSQIQQQQAQIASQADQIKSQGDALAALRTRLALLEQARRHQRQRKSIRNGT
ncbi:MAG TPA: tail fiber domain-containing protein [Pyrinomonadaceae bacterium]|nr:tail fiber domain-containing protein [Pyrinomonadaceae bacterium]